MKNNLSAHSRGSLAAKALDSHISALRRSNELPGELFDKVEPVIGDYCHFRDIRHGENVVIAGVETSWHFNNDYLEEGAHITVCVKQGREWDDDQYIDEVPPSFLLHILETIRRECRLWDPRPAEIESQARQYLLALKAEKPERQKIWLNALPQREQRHAGGAK